MIEQISLTDINREIEKRKYNKFNYVFPESGPLSRHNYKKHMEFFDATKDFIEVSSIAANRVGKTFKGAYAVTCWLTGIYPDWWTGKRFDGPVNGMACGETSKLVRDSLQLELLGPLTDRGSGMIPRHLIVNTFPKAGLPNAIEIVHVRHVSGGVSTIQFMSYDQGREVFQATKRDFIWQDEEPPIDIHAENLLRTMTLKGLVISTFTPLKGMTEIIIDAYRKAEEGISRVISLTWDDAPHLDEDQKKKLWDAIPPYQRDARAKGIPQLGSGAIYPISLSDITVDDFPIPESWKVGFGKDVGWNNTACLWFAHDLENDIVYITGEYKRGQAEPAVHASAIKARGVQNGAIDPASRGRSQADGQKLIDLYNKEYDGSVTLHIADNAVETGIYDVYIRLTTGKLKVFKSCQMFANEFKMYRRDDKGKVVKEHDHLMDCLRYAIRTGIKVADYAKSVVKEVKSFKISGKSSRFGKGRL